MSVLVVAFIVVSMLTAGAVAKLGSAVVARSRANNAADAAALAAADQLALGGSSAGACAAARSTAVDNGARVVTCRTDGAAAAVVVTLGDARARARAEAGAAAPAALDTGESARTVRNGRPRAVAASGALAHRQHGTHW